MQANHNSFLAARKTGFFTYAVMLVLISVLIRLIVYLLLPPVFDYAATFSWVLYFSALTEHFSDYLVFTTNIPPGTLIVHAAILRLMNPATAVSVRLFLILVSVLNITGIVMLYNSAKRVGANLKFSFIICSLFSIALIAFELWRDGMHYDHLTFFLTCFFVWSLVRIRSNHSLLNAGLIALSAGMLVSQSAASAAIVPFSIIAWFCLLYLPQKKYKSLVLALCIGLSLPFLTLFIIGRKNASETQESLTSNKAGPAMMMVVQRAYNFDVSAVRSIMQRGGAPEWYLWTYDHATAPVDPLTMETYPEILPLSQAFGICFFSGTGEGPWKFDFNPLVNYLSVNGPQDLLPSVKADAEDAVIRPYRFAGFSSELSPRWIGVYGSVSKKIFFKALQDNPVGMLKAFAKQQSVFGICGPLFMYNVTQNKHSFLARGGLRTLKEKLPLHLLIEGAALVFAGLAFGMYLLCLGIIPFVLFKSVNNRNRGTSYIHHPLLLLSIPVICIAVVYSCLVGGENDRYFMQATPYIVIMLCYLPVVFKKQLSKFNSLQQFIS